MYVTKVLNSYLNSTVPRKKEPHGKNPFFNQLFTLNKLQVIHVTNVFLGIKESVFQPAFFFVKLRDM
jgi:hypothetical protein